MRQTETVIVDYVVRSIDYGDGLVHVFAQGERGRRRIRLHLIIPLQQYHRLLTPLKQLPLKFG